MRYVNALKLAYLLTISLPEHERRTNPKSKVQNEPYACVWCLGPSNIYCKKCLTSVATHSIAIYRASTTDDAEITKNLLSTDRHPADDVLLVAVSCLIKLSLAAQSIHTTDTIATPRVAYLLQAIVLLEKATLRSTANFHFTLMLVRLYSSLGCGSLAMRAFDRLSVKQIQLDTMSYILFDRVSSLHPRPFPQLSNDLGDSAAPSDHFSKQHQLYRKTRKQVARNTWTAFEHGSYNAVFEFQEFSDTIAHSVSAVNSVVESARLSRILKIDKKSSNDILRK